MGKLVAYALAGLILLALLSWIVAALYIALLILLIWSAITHPLEFAAWLGFGLVIALFQLHPLASIAVFAVGYIVHRCLRVRETPPVLLLPPPTDLPPD